MTEQLDLFSVHREPLAQPLAKAPSRSTDPSSSHAAGESMSKGAAKAQAEKCADLVFMAPGSTAAELAELSKRVHGEEALDAVKIRKRLPHIEDIEAGEPRICKVAKNLQQVWKPKAGE